MCGRRCAASTKWPSGSCRSVLTGTRAARCTLPALSEPGRSWRPRSHAARCPGAAPFVAAAVVVGMPAARQSFRRLRSLPPFAARGATLLQEMFQRVYGVRSSSNNNLWLRKKLIEAVNTRPRGALGPPERAASRPLPPEPARAAPAPGAPAPEAGAADPSLRRRKKKGAPVRASDGFQVTCRPALPAACLLFCCATVVSEPRTSMPGAVGPCAGPAVRAHGLFSMHPGLPRPAPAG